MRVHVRGSLIFSVMLSLFVVVLLVTALQYLREVRVVPFVIGIPTLFLLFILLIGEFYPSVMQWMESTLEDLWGGKTRGSGAGVRSEDMTSWWSILGIVGWAVVFFVLVFFLGFYLVPPLFIAVFLTVEAEVPLHRAILSSLITSAALYGGMALLRVDLWSGAIPEIIPGLLGGAIIPPL